MRNIGKVEFCAFSLVHVIASKVTAGIGTEAWYKARLDIGGLYRAGLFKPQEVRRFLSEAEVPYREEFDQIMQEVQGQV